MGIFWKMNATEMPRAAPASSLWVFSLHVHDCAPQKEQGWGHRERGAASLAAERLYLCC